MGYATSEILEDNQLLHEFLGLTINTYDGVEYHTSWDLLFPIIDKINGLGKEYQFAIFKTYTSCTVEKGGKVFKDFSFAHAEYITVNQTSKEAVYKLLVKFVRWYKNQLNFSS